MSMLTIHEATGITGKSRSTILRMIKKGKLTGKRREDQSYEIEASELARVFPDAYKQDSESQRSTVESAEQLSASDDYVSLLKQTVADQRQQIEKLEASRERLEDIVAEQCGVISGSQQLLLTHDEQDHPALKPPVQRSSDDPFMPHQGGAVKYIKSKLSAIFSAERTDDSPTAAPHTGQ